MVKIKKKTLKRANCLFFLPLKKNQAPILVDKNINFLYYTSPMLTKLTINDQWLFYIYLKNLSYYYLNVNLNWKFVDLETVSLNKNFLLKLWYKIYKKKFFGIFYGKKKTTLSWFLQLYKLKDPQGMIFIIQNLLFRSRLKKHKKLFFLVGSFFKMLFLYKDPKDSLKGCSLFFKGKLGKKGSVRKSKFFFKSGKISLTNKSLRINYRNYEIITITGVVGCNICVFYQ